MHYKVHYKAKKAKINRQKNMQIEKYTCKLRHHGLTAHVLLILAIQTNTEMHCKNRNFVKTVSYCTSNVKYLNLC